MEKTEKIAIDLLWLRPGKVGGTESYIRNLLDGFLEMKEDFAFTLLVSKDNAASFEKYEKDERFSLLKADVFSENIGGRIIWQNLHQNRFLRRHGFRKCFEPVYCKPWLNGGIEYTCVIHDIQAFHYPEYHPFYEVFYSRLCWRMDTWNAARLLTISNWVKEDIEQKYHRKDIQVIYNPIVANQNEMEEPEVLQDTFSVEKGRFFYTVTQMIPHKNLKVLIEIMKKIRESEHELPQKLVISGVNGTGTEEFWQMVKKNQLESNVILTGYISNKMRNTLYKNCYAFLFPSIFEGFGMPPVEAMLFGAKTITTRCTSLPEVTQGKAIYVENPFDAEEWLEKIKRGENKSGEADFKVYAADHISLQYLNILKEAVWKKK